MLHYKKAPESECSNTFWPNTLAKHFPLHLSSIILHSLVFATGCHYTKRFYLFQDIFMYFFCISSTLLDTIYINIFWYFQYTIFKFSHFYWLNILYSPANSVSIFTCILYLGNSSFKILFTFSITSSDFISKSLVISQ